MTIRSMFSNDQLVDWWGEGKTADEFAQGMQSVGMSDTAQNIAEAIRIASGGMYSLKPEEVSGWVGANQDYSNILDQYLELPEWSYDGSGLKADEYGTLQASNVLQDYYGQLSNNYLPSLDTFAKENAGQMVAFDPNRFMTAEDFGLGDGGGVNRGSLRNQDLLNASHDLTWQNVGDTGGTPSYYTKAADGQYRVASGKDGEELFTLSYSEPTWENDQRSPVYTSAGKYHKETPEEAMVRLLAQGGGYRSGTVNDFMGLESLTGLTKDGSGKWGADYVKDPTLQQYLDDPNWVSKDEEGNITNIRAELYPMLMREQLGQEYRDIARGGTKDAGGFGDLVKTAILGVATGGLGLAGASALGLGSAAAGAGLGATAAGMGTAGLATAGAISGGLSAALTDQDILKGALTGGVLGGVGGFAKDYAGGLSDSIGLSNIAGDKLGTSIVTGGIKGLASGALSGDATTGMLSGAVSPVIGAGVDTVAPGLGDGLSNTAAKALTIAAFGGDPTSAIAGGLLKNGASYVGDALFGGDGSSLPTDAQLQELQFTNPDAYDWYMFGDQMGNLDQTDYSWMNNQVGNGEQTGYTGTTQGDTQMGWLDNLFSEGGVLGDNTSSFIDSLAIDSMSDSDALDWLANYDEFAPGADYSFNDNILDYFNTDGNNLLGSGSTMPDWFGGYDPLVSDSNVTDLISNTNPDYSFGGLVKPSGGDLGSTITGTDTGSGGGVLGSIKDGVQELLGGGTTGAANSALIYELLKALMKSKQGENANELSAESVNMVINAGENGAPRRTGTNFGAPRTAVGNVPVLPNVSNGQFKLGLTRN